MHASRKCVTIYHQYQKYSKKFINKLEDEDFKGQQAFNQAKAGYHVCVRRRFLEMDGAKLDNPEIPRVLSKGIATCCALD